VVYISMITVLMLILFTILTSLNIVGCFNGTSGIMLYIYFFPLTIAAVLYGSRITRLGRSLIPLSKAQLTLDDKQESKLAKPDTILFILNFIGQIQWLIQPTALVITAPIFPGDFTPLSVSFYSYGIMDIAMSIAWAWQLNRLITVAKTAQNRNNDGNRINSAIKLLRNQQFFVFVPGTGYGVLWIMLGTGILSFSYIMVIIVLASEALCMFGFVLRFNGKSNVTRTAGTTGTATDRKNNKDFDNTGSYHSNNNNKRSQKLQLGVYNNENLAPEPKSQSNSMASSVAN
jgi:hypothetical protein